MGEIKEIKITAEQWQREMDSNVPLATHHRFADWPAALEYLLTVPDKEVLHMWDMGDYIKVAIIRRATLDAYRKKGKKAIEANA